MAAKHLLALAFALSCFCLPAAAQVSFAPLAARLMPSVVNISTTQQEAGDEPGVVDNLLFAAPDGRIALGSGFVISRDGYIATNRHVIEHAEKISVITADGGEYEAVLIGDDSETDIALIKINPVTELLPVRFGNSDAVNVGDWILAVGNPFGLGSSVTAGIISAKSRDIGSGPYDNYLQTDASINQGNSGGPMFDIEGRLVGINTAVFSAPGHNSGIGFALPSNQAAWVLAQLREKGRVERSWLGIAVKTGKTSDGQKGLSITSFYDEKLPVENGLQLGDIILEAGGIPVETPKMFSSRIAGMPAGSTVVLKIWRNGRILDLQAVSGIMPDRTEKQKPIAGEKGAGMLTVNGESAALKERSAPFGLVFNGLKVLSVTQNSQAAAKGVRPGDRVVRANGNLLLAAEDLYRRLEETSASGETLRLDMESAAGEAYFVDFAAEKPGAGLKGKN